MKLTAEVVDETIEQIKNYQRDHFGTPNGPDFPLIAEELAKSKAFGELCVAQGMMGLISTLRLPQKLEANKEASPDKFIEDMKTSPLREGLALMFYAGFKLGQRFTETQNLENLTNEWMKKD